MVKKHSTSPWRTPQKVFFSAGHLAALGSLEDNESEDESGDDEQSSQSESEESDGEKLTEIKEIEEVELSNNSISVKEFLEAPIAKNFLALGSNKEQLLLEAAQVTHPD